jgi:hypothetical protein
VDAKEFEKLLKGVREAGEIVRGERAPARETLVDSTLVKELRKSLKLQSGPVRGPAHRGPWHAAQLGTGQAGAARAGEGFATGYPQGPAECPEGAGCLTGHVAIRR